MSNVNAVTFTIVVVLFLVVTLTGFAAARWRRAEDMLHLNEWGLGGRSFGTFVAWFCSAATSTPPTRSSRSPRRCSAPAR